MTLISQGAFDDNSCRLLSLWEIMEKFHPQLFTALSRHLAKLEELIENPPEHWNRLLQTIGGKHVSDRIKNLLEVCRDVCKTAGMTHSVVLINSALLNQTHSQQEIRLIAKIMESELKQGTYLKIPENRATYWENHALISETVSSRFPSASAELVDAGTAYALALNTACVFHAMRAAEIGLRVLATDLSVTFPHGNLELEQWHTILNQIESKIAGFNKLPKSTQKSEDQHFYSQAALQFRYFKDGARVRVAHARESFGETQALGLLNHTCEFFEVLASRLKEDV